MKLDKVVLEKKSFLILQDTKHQKMVLYIKREKIIL